MSVRLAVVGGGVGGLAAAFEAVHAGLDPASIAVVEARPEPALQRNLVVDRFMLERLAHFGVRPASLNPWTDLAVTLADAEMTAGTDGAPDVVLGVAYGGGHAAPRGQLRRDGRGWRAASAMRV